MPAVERVERQYVEGAENDVDRGQQPDQVADPERLRLGADVHHPDRAHRADLVGYVGIPHQHPAKPGQRGGLDQLAEETEGGADGIGERLACQPHRLADAHRPKGDLRRHP